MTVGEQIYEFLTAHFEYPSTSTAVEGSATLKLTPPLTTLPGAATRSAELACLSACLSVARQTCQQVFHTGTVVDAHHRLSTRRILSAQCIDQVVVLQASR